MEIVHQLNIIDDTLFQKMAEDIEFCEEMISTIMGQKIKVKKVVPQNSIKNLQGRSVVLDALCETEDGKEYNVEVQKADDDDHQKRVRYGFLKNLKHIISRSSRKYRGVKNSLRKVKEETRLCVI